MEPYIIFDIIISIIVIFFVSIYVYWQVKKKGLRSFVIEMIIRAEEIFIKGQNETKINFVIDKVISTLPLPLQFFITRDMVRKFIQTVFDELKKALDYKPQK